MPTRIPKLCQHKSSGQAVVRLGGRDGYLGSWGTPRAKTEYDRVIAEWLAGGRHADAVNDLTVAELLAAFWDHAEVYYRDGDGKPTNELRNLRDAMGPLRRLYGRTAAAQFGPLALKAVRQAMIEAGLCRTSINRRVNRLKHIFKWGVENELIPASIYHGLQALAGLRAGRSEARESAPVRPVPDALVEAVLACASRQVGAMIRLQRLTGMRPGEVCSMRGIDLDTTGKLWLYRPARHKTAYLGHERMIFLGPRAQEIIRPFLKPDLTAHLFCPAEVERERRQIQHARRRTPLSCGNIPGSNVKRKPRKKPGNCYSVTAYARAVRDACDRAFPLPEHLKPERFDQRRETLKAWRLRLTPKQTVEIKAHRKAHRWHPNQLRHSAATTLRKTYGLEPAQVILGHKALTVTQVYAEKNIATAMKIMAEVG